MGKYIEQYKQMYYAGDMLYAHLVDIVRLVEETNSQSLLDFGGVMAKAAGGATDKMKKEGTGFYKD